MTGVKRSVRRAVSGVIPDESSDDSTWEGGGNMTAMEQPGRGVWTSDFQDDLTSKGSPAEMPGGGMPGQSGEKDGNTGALPTLAYPKHRGNSGRGKPTPPTVSPILHAGPPAGLERQAPDHVLVCQGAGAEEVTIHGGGDEGDIRAGLRGIRRTDTECFSI